MPKLVELDNVAHRELKIDSKKIESMAREERMIPVVISEFLNLSLQYPVVFTKNVETGQFTAVAVLGFEEGENLFFVNGRWEGIYQPLNLVRQPFFLTRKNNEVVMCIDIDSPVVSRYEGQRIFDEEGGETDLLESVKSVLAELNISDVQTKSFIQTLLEYELIRSISLDIKLANDEKLKIQGIYTIDEEKLGSLNENHLFDLHSKNYLKPIYAMLVSLGHAYTLASKKLGNLEKPT